MGVGYLVGKKLAPNKDLALSSRLVELEKAKAILEERALHLQAQAESAKKQSEQMSEQLKAQFENIAHKILDANTQRFQEFGERNISNILTPLKEKIQGFEKRVEETYNNESRERFALKTELKNIVELNQQMTQEARDLTRALKADVKTQGNWGELILDRILSNSGLREGIEYTTQGQGLKLKSQEGDHLKPDVIIHLPDEKHLIIDSKVSLKSYETFCNVQDEDSRKKSLAEFIDSVRRHADGLSSKHYSSLEGLRSPDFVLLFMPLEGAFALALQSDPDLFLRAWDKQVAIVSPTTLFTNLRTVASLWRSENQKKYADDIARESGALYDKFVLFTEDLKKIGRSIEMSQSTYHEALGKLATGRGNLVARVERIRKLGAKSTKQLDNKLVEEEPLTDPQESLEGL